MRRSRGAGGAAGAHGGGGDAGGAAIPDRYRGRPWPLAGLGFRYATAVGFAWGSLWSTGRVERVDGLWVFRGMPRWAFGRGGSCVGACYLTRDNAAPRMLRHERVHVAQWRHYGMAMPLLYLLEGRDPLRNRFEIEAGLEDGGYVRRGAARAGAPRA